MTCLADTSPLNDCGHPGLYGTDPVTDKTRCYDCCHLHDLALISDSKPGDTFVGYISGDGKTWTTWPGGTLGHVIWRGARHNWSRERFYYGVRDQHRRVWSGTGAPGMWATLRLSKETA